MPHPDTAPYAAVVRTINGHCAEAGGGRQMTHRRAAIPAPVGALSLTLMLWWAGASAQALELRGTTNLLDIQSMNELRRWLTPWAYDAPATLLPRSSWRGSP